MLHFTPHQLEIVLATYGYWAVLLFVAVESTGVPVPGETMLLVASVYAGTTHRLEVAGVIAAATAGAIIGDNIGFVLGRTGGHRLLQRFGKYVRLDQHKLRLGEFLFDRHGGKVVFFGRFVPVLRIWAAFLAGTNQMSWTRFLAFNAAGGALWATLMGLAAYGLGNAMLRLGGTIGFAIAALATLAMLAVMLVLKRQEERLQEQADGSPAIECTATIRLLP